MGEVLFKKLQGNHWGQFILFNAVVFFLLRALSLLHVFHVHALYIARGYIGWIVFFASVFLNSWLAYKLDIGSKKGIFAAIWVLVTILGVIFVGDISPIMVIYHLPMVIKSYSNIGYF